MNYYGTIILTHLPYAREEMMMVEGKEERCLLLPIKRCQMRRGKDGGLCINFEMHEEAPGPTKKTHYVRLSFLNRDEKQKCKDEGTFNRAMRLGHTFAFVDDISKRKDRTNNMTPILCTGTLILSDIKPEDIQQDPETGKKYIRFTFRKTQALDAFGNSHEIITAGQFGENQIGVAREWKMGGQIERLGNIVARDNPQAVQQTPAAPATPTTIDGYTF